MSLIIAEIGTSHEGDEKKAFELIDAAVAAGSDAVKFQWVYADEILHPNTGIVELPTGKIPLYERYKALECSPDFYEKMADYANKKGVKFICTPFGLRSLKELLELKPYAIKIASPELNHFPLLYALRNFRLEQKKRGENLIPVILSSGVSKLSDIEKALSILGTEGVTLLHCITSYPAPEEEYNVRLIKNLSNIFAVPTGLSDHSLDPILVPVLSVLCGGTVIEKHITLSKKTAGLDDPVALEPEQFALMVHSVHQTEAVLSRYGSEKGFSYALNQLEESYSSERIEKVLGTGKKFLAPSEQNNYGRTNRSLHFMRELHKGDVVTKSDIGVLRTEKVLLPGISPEYAELVIGKKLFRDIKNGDGVQFEDFMCNNND